MIKFATDPKLYTMNKTSRRNLIIFDIDGTLTQTACVDDELFINAFKYYFDLTNINKNWETYRYSTDSGLLLELFEKHLNRTPRNHEIKDIQTNFFDELRSLFSKNPLTCQTVPGAECIFNKIRSLKYWDIAIATGCWEQSAITKLSVAGLFDESIPLACSDKHIERHDIINFAISKSKLHYQQDNYHKIIYVGDRLWDKKSADRLNIEFIGVGDSFGDMENNTFLHVIDYRSDHFLKFLS